MHTVQKPHAQSGFTLIELSIVLVIVGLIAGGILVGQDMIKAAEIRSTLKQVEQLNASMNTFRDKYRYLPGDITSTAAVQFGFAARTGAVGRGDGNSYIEGAAAAATVLNSETVLAWRDLNFVNLIDGAYTVATDAPAAATNPDLVKTLLPEAKLGRGNMITVFASAGYNHYQIAGITAIAAGVPTLAAALSPQEAFNLDEKLDDGVPGTGSVRAMLATGTALNTAAVAAPPAAGVCVSNAVGNPYNTTTEEFANAPACGIRIRTN